MDFGFVVFGFYFLFQFVIQYVKVNGWSAVWCVMWAVCVQCVRLAWPAGEGIRVLPGPTSADGVCVSRAQEALDGEGVCVCVCKGTVCVGTVSCGCVCVCCGISWFQP